MNEIKADRTSTVLPDSLRRQLSDFQRSVWKSKMLEALWLACVGLGIGFLVVFVLDRLFDTSQAMRGLIATVTFGLWLLLPWAFHRWVWNHRRYDQLARLLRRKSPSFGDELLGAIELADNPAEQSRSPALCAAALRQVAERAAQRDLSASAPASHHRRWGRMAATVGAFALLLSLVLPSVTWNAACRLFAPWLPIDRYTFAQFEPLPDRMVVPHGEGFTVAAQLLQETRWSPATGTVRLPHNERIQSAIDENRYEFAIPSLSADARLDMRIGDYVHRMTIEPKLRPELTSLRALVELPAYLQQPDRLDRDLRGGTMSVVTGSRIALSGVANRDLASSRIFLRRGTKATQEGTKSDKAAEPTGDETETNFDDRNASPVEVVGTRTEGPQFDSESIDITEGETFVSIAWSDRDALTGRSPLRGTLLGIPDAPPMVATEDLPRQAIILSSEQLNFRILATDDFGVKQVGIEWSRMADSSESSQESERPTSATEVPSQRVLASGGPQASSFVSSATFRPLDLGIESQAIELRMWAEDYLPGRPRSYSVAHRFLVLTPDEHAVWITEQLNKWHRQSLDVRDRELQLYQTNKELRQLPLDAFEDPVTRQRLEDQAAGEAANERRLKSLATAGESLLRQASRNPELGVGHLERWAEMLKVLDDIASNRMPQVTDLLQQAARQNKSASTASNKKTGPTVGNVRTMPQGDQGDQPKEAPPEDSKRPTLPAIADVESSQQPPSDAPAADSEDKPKKPSASRFTLPNTILIGPPQATEPSPESPSQEKTDEAVREQEDLLAEFEKLADEMNKVLGELEGTTLVKRLKAASREQIQVAQELAKRLESIISIPRVNARSAVAEAVRDLSEIEAKGSLKVSNIIDDLEAFYERRRSIKFRDVLKEMEDSQVVAAIRQLSDEVKTEQGMSIAQAEYWSDTMDRWAEDLVDPACKGECPGCKNADSLPPSIVLEVLQILEGQTNLRERTRVAEQASEAAGQEEHAREATKLAGDQEGLTERVDQVLTKIADLPDGNTRFADEVGLLGQAENLMVESESVLAAGNTGQKSMAIQTEIIELLLQSKRINPKGGGGGGGKAPGGGGKGDTSEVALALLGAGLNAKEKREMRETSQATGITGASLPEEFRDGLNQYFQRLEQSPSNAKASASP